MNMYLLLKSDGSSLYLNNGETYLIGRKATNFILEDKTVSKTHAKISVRNKNVFVEDLNSSNKTFVNEKALIPSVETQVKVGSQIKFGTQDSNFILKKDDLKITMSGLSNSDKEELKKIIEKMSGSIIASWNAVCTHVVVAEIVLTVKVLCALIHKQPIVTINYFKARLNWMENNGPPPNVKDFRPPLSEDKLHKQMVVDYEMDRVNLFKNKIFVFPNKASKKKIESIITLAGGSSISFDSNPVQKTNLIKNTIQYIFVITAENTQSEQNNFNDCVKYLMEHDRRSIPMSEIAMAILEGSCEVECNPFFNKVGHVMGGERPKISNDVIASETQTQVPPQSSQSSYDSNCSVQCIPNSLSPTGTEPMEVETGSKRQGAELIRNPKKSKGDDSDNRSVSSQNEGKMVQKKVDNFFKKPSGSSQNVSSGPISQHSIFEESLDDNVSTTSSALQSIKRKSEEQTHNIQKKPKFSLSDLMSSTQSSGISPIKKTGTQQLDDPLPPSHSTQLDSSNPFLKIEIKQNKEVKTRFNLDFGPKEKETIQPQTDITKISKALEKMTHKEKPADLVHTQNSKKRSASDDASATTTAIEINTNNTTTVSKKTKVKHGKENIGAMNVFSSTRMDGESFINVTAISDLSHATNCNRWLNKSSISVTLKSVQEDEISDVTKAYIKNFKPAKVVVVSANSLIVRRPQDSTLNTTNSTSKSKLPNFKKFKKVKPLHEQTEIIPRECYVTVICREKGNKKPVEFEETILDTQPVGKPTNSRSKFHFEM